MKQEREVQDNMNKRAPDKKSNIQPVSNDQHIENEDKGQEGAHGKKKFVDRVRRGYPDGPGGSYEGF